MFDLRQVVHFIEVAQTGSLTQTALQLDVSHSVLSREIQDLELQLGQRLFHRTGRGMKLTEFGRQLLPRAQRLMLEVSRLSDEASTLHGCLRGAVTIALPGSVTALIAAPLIALVRARFPDVYLRFVDAVSGAIEELLASGRIDIGLFYTGQADAQRGDVRLTISRLFLIGPRRDALTAKPSVTLAQVAKCDLILPSRPGGVRAIVEDAASKMGLRLRIPCEIDSLLALKEVVRAGVGYTVCSMDAVASDVRAGQLQAAPICEPELTRTLVINLASKQSLTIAARAVAELIPSATQPLIDVGHWLPRASADHTRPPKRSIPRGDRESQASI
jgi:DNA-binding transcriptional LysR family regulator